MDGLKPARRVDPVCASVTIGVKSVDDGGNGVGEESLELFIWCEWGEEEYW